MKAKEASLEMPLYKREDRKQGKAVEPDGEPEAHHHHGRGTRVLATE